MKKVIITIIAIAVIAAGVYLYLGFRSAQQARAAADSIQTEPLRKGSLESTISATGKVRTSQSASLTWKTSGTVEAVNVKVGDVVKAGDRLASLQQTSLPQNVITAQADLASAEQAQQDLYSNAAASAVKAMQDIVTYEQAVKDAQYALDNFTTPTNQASLDAVTALDQAKTALDKARANFEPYKFLSSGNANRQRLKTALDEAQADYNTAVKRLSLEYDLQVAQANQFNARNSYEKWKNGPVAADVEAAKAKIAAAEANIKLAYLEAPFDGTITEVDPQPGDQVTQSTLAFRIDNLEHLFVDLQVSEIDISQIKPGQDVKLTLDAIRNKTYNGQVTDVSIIGEAGTNVVNFTVTVQLTDADAAVLAGMTSEVEIVIAQRQGVLMIPNQAIRPANGKQVVYVMRPGQGRVEVPVTLGVASDTASELVSGDLKEGDLVVLNPAAESDNAQPRFFGPFGEGQRRQAPNNRNQNQNGDHGPQPAQPPDSSGGQP